jgi:hypothetical protein
MRLPVVLISSVLVAASTATAQDLQYRMRSRVSMPDLPAAAAPTTETLMFMKGGRIRLDTRTSEGSNSIIVNTEAGRMYLVDHASKTYREQLMPRVIGKPPATDTAAIRAMGVMPQVTQTNEKRTILGFEASRVLSVQRVPYPSDPNASMVTVTESWISRDPRLMKAYNASMQAAQRVLGAETSAMMEMISGHMQGVPLETTTIALQRNDKKPVDPAVILKQANPEGLMMRNHMEPVEVKLVTLAESIFAVPLGYKKLN